MSLPLLPLSTMFKLPPLWDLKIVHHRIVLQLVTGLQLHGVHSKTTRVYIPNRAEIMRKYEMSKYGKFEILTSPPAFLVSWLQISGSLKSESHISNISLDRSSQSNRAWICGPSKLKHAHRQFSTSLILIDISTGLLLLNRINLHQNHFVSCISSRLTPCRHCWSLTLAIIDVKWR